MPLAQRSQKYIQKYSCGIKSAWETFKLPVVFLELFLSTSPLETLESASFLPVHRCSPTFNPLRQKTIHFNAKINAGAVNSI